MEELINILRTHACQMQPVATDVEPRLPRMEGIRAVLFDVYGTLLISASGDVGTVAAAPGEAFAGACAAQGIDFNGPLQAGPSAFIQAIEQSHADSIRQGVEYPEVDILNVWRMTLEWLQSQEAIANATAVDDINLRMLALDYEVRVNPVWPMPGVESCLFDLRAAGMKMGIVSNAQFFTPVLFPALLGKSLGDIGFAETLCVWSYQHGQAKPGAFLYQRASELLAGQSIEPAEVLYIGNDLFNDVMPAQRIGFRTALFAGDRRSLRLRVGDERIAGIEPDCIVTHLQQIAPLLGIPNCSKGE